MDRPAMISRRRFLSAVPGAVVAALPAGAQAPRLQGLWMGGVVPRGITIKVLTAAVGLPVVLAVDAGAAEEASPPERVVVSDADGVATFVLTDLTPGSRRRFTVSTGGEPALAGAFRTPAEGPFSFRLAFASCAATGSSSPVFTAIRDLAPDLFVHMGDLHYEDIHENDVARFRRAYAQVLASTTQSALFRSVPLAYTWDDHDFGPNNSDRTSPSRSAALRAYRTFLPHYPMSQPADAPVFQAFSLGRVRVLLTDSRSARSPARAPESGRTMLGTVQLEWLEQELAAAAGASLVVLVNSVPWITRRRSWIRHGWAPYARERRHIADLIVRHGLTRRLVMLSGDAHMLAMDDGTHSQYSTRADAPARGFVVAHAAPLDRKPSRKGGPYTHREVAMNGQYGVMDVTDEGGPVTVRLRGMRGSQPVPGMALRFTTPGAD